jgi:AraC-like DNA-binding protein
MYYPSQVSLVLGNKFSHAIRYSEKIIHQYNDFVICLWDIQPVSKAKKNTAFTIVTDGCIDLVVDYQYKSIWFVGMSKTNFNYKVNMPSYLIGARFKPGAFYAITNMPANKAMDEFIPLSALDKDFPMDSFFTLPFSEAKKYFTEYIGKLIQGKNTNKFITLFDELNENIPDTVSEIYQKLNYSPRQCQRLFIKNYGLSPQMVLCILRFQKCLENITSGKKRPQEALEISNYYDQSHFIKDFKRHIGLTPLELIEKYSS